MQEPCYTGALVAVQRISIDRTLQHAPHKQRSYKAAWVSSPQIPVHSADLSIGLDRNRRRADLRGFTQGWIKRVCQVSVLFQVLGLDAAVALIECYARGASSNIPLPPP